MEKALFTGYITKYALTQGITEVEMRIASPAGDMVEVRDGELFHGEGREWHRTREGAVSKANDMRLKKIAALQKQLKSLETPIV